ncbi:MAG: adenylate/guanylate cyclase domain-containing protein [Stellaceae bacterium]
MPPVRRLTAILAADVAGYSRLMGADEEGTHERLKAHLAELVNPKIKEHRGRLVKNTGDGFLTEFASVVDAVRCATEIQRGMVDREPEGPEERRIRFRIGINLGDVIAEEHDIFGDGVNIAARLEGLAEPGGICVSRVVRDQVRDKLNCAFQDMGEQQVKNIARPVRVYGLPDLSTVANSVAAPVLTFPDKPSIAVLPFANFTGGLEQEFFADGITEDIITALSKIRSLFVIARNSSFTFKGKYAPIKDIGRELGVRYILEGSVRKAGNRVRVTAQLVEAATGGHLWAERYDRELADIFAVQDEITECVRASIQPAVERSERERAARRTPENLDAWESYHRGIWHFSKFDEAENQKAQSFFYRAINLDAQFASAYAMLASTYCRAAGYFRPEHKPENIRHAVNCARAALKIDPTDAGGTLGWQLL